MTHPREFLDEYALPAAALFRSHPMEKHLAAHAIAQFDILAEVVFTWTLQGSTPGRGDASRFRDALGARHQALRNIRDAHDSHKHGELSRSNTYKMSRGQRPQMGRRPFMFLYFDNERAEMHPTDALVIELNDGSELAVWPLLIQAEDAWTAEFERLVL